jgi:hypothetical protein
MKTMCLFRSFTDDPTTSVQNNDTSDKEICTARIASAGSTTAREKDEEYEEGIVIRIVLM